MTTDLADIHVLVDPELKSRLQEFYPGHGQLSILVRSILDLIDIQLQHTERVDVLQIARTIIEDERRRGTRGTDRSTGKKA